MDVRQTRRNNLAALLAARGARKALAEAVDSDPAYLSQLLSPRIKADMGHDLARRIERALGKPPGWMDQPHDDAPRVAEPAGEYQATVREVRVYPLISWVQAGDWADIVTDGLPAHAAQEWHPCGVRCGPRTFVLRVQGQSMEPRFTEGELIFVDPDAEARNGSFVVVRLDDAHQATFKQLIIEGDRRYLRPLNDRWPDPIIEINGRATLCGVVVFQGRAV
jgi:SOS-response transcriptional repressor LexA